MKKTEMCTLAQRQYLLGRLRQSRSYDKRTEPKEVKRARRLIDDYERRDAQARSAARKRYDEACRAATEAIHFGAVGAAIKAVQRAEQLGNL